MFPLGDALGAGLTHQRLQPQQRQRLRRGLGPGLRQQTQRGGVALRFLREHDEALQLIGLDAVAQLWVVPDAAVGALRAALFAHVPGDVAQQPLVRSEQIDIVATRGLGGSAAIGDDGSSRCAAAGRVVWEVLGLLERLPGLLELPVLQQGDGVVDTAAQAKRPALQRLGVRRQRSVHLAHIAQQPSQGGEHLGLLDRGLAQNAHRFFRMAAYLQRLGVLQPLVCGERGVRGALFPIGVQAAARMQRERQPTQFVEGVAGELGAQQGDPLLHGGVGLAAPLQHLGAAFGPSAAARLLRQRGVGDVHRAAQIAPGQQHLPGQFALRRGEGLAQRGGGQVEIDGFAQPITRLGGLVGAQCQLHHEPRHLRRNRAATQRRSGLAIGLRRIAGGQQGAGGLLDELLALGLSHPGLGGGEQDLRRQWLGVHAHQQTRSL